MILCAGGPRGLSLALFLAEDADEVREQVLSLRKLVTQIH